MKTSRNPNDTNIPKRSNLRQTLSSEKETLVSMFLCSASSNDINEQIRKIDELCSQLDQKWKQPFQ